MFDQKQVKVGLIQNRGLRRLQKSGDGSKLDQRLVGDLRKQLEFLQAMERAEEMAGLPTWKPHRLNDLRWSLHVTANWRLTLRIGEAAGEISVLDLEDDHEEGDAAHRASGAKENCDDA